MIRRFFLSLAASVALVTLLSAQMERTIYQVFPADSIPTIQLDLTHATYEIVAWAGDNLMVETNIRVWNASPEIVKHLIELGRYELVAEKKEQSLLIGHKLKERKPIKTPRGECTEIAQIKLFVPDMYHWTKEEPTILRLTPAPQGGGD